MKFYEFVRLACLLANPKRVLTAVIILTIVVLLGACSIGRDREEAGKVADRVHLQMRTGDFSGIYQDSAPRFKSVGSESKFLEVMREIQERLGSLQNTQEIAYQTGMDSRIGRTHVLIFDLEFERGHAREVMIIVRSESGPMQLWKLEIKPT